MCGILGYCSFGNSDLEESAHRVVFERLFMLSQSRGSESSGWHARLPTVEKSWTVKAALSATDLIRHSESKRHFGQFDAAAFPPNKATLPFSILGHSRLVTNGASDNAANNQPVRYRHTTIIHNGIIVNANDLWEDHPGLRRTAEVDTEILAALMDAQLEEHGDLITAARHVFGAIKGTASIAALVDGFPYMLLGTNTGDLYFAYSPTSGTFLFASERHLLDDVVREADFKIHWLQQRDALVLDLCSGSIIEFSLEDTHLVEGVPNVKLGAPHHAVEVAVQSPAVKFQIKRRSADEQLLKYSESGVLSLKRCSKCILPETFPFIVFNEQGVCNYCLNYQPKYLGKDPEVLKEEFLDTILHYRKDNDRADVLVPFSGGRDSCYALHLIKKEFGFSPTTFTYDWGMVTDLARRNIARLCGDLGVQNILVSANIRKKRDNIRRNIVAWLKKPELGIVPLFMAGDKHFFRIVNQIKAQTGIRLDLWAANPLENTDFKSGFCGVRPDFAKKRVDYLSFTKKIQMAAYYGSQFIQNPGYLNASMLDTATAFASYYLEPRRDFYFIFHHLIWEEETVNRLLLESYDFERSPDSSSTWRIGDGTAPFYNYIYLTSRGFSEFDTFRSNQIREGMLKREEALRLVAIENRPRYETLKWYFDALNLDFDSVIKTINRMDVRHLHA